MLHTGIFRRLQQREGDQPSTTGSKQQRLIKKRNARSVDRDGIPNSASVCLDCVVASLYANIYQSLCIRLVVSFEFIFKDGFQTFDFLMRQIASHSTVCRREKLSRLPADINSRTIFKQFRLLVGLASNVCWFCFHSSIFNDQSLTVQI